MRILPQPDFPRRCPDCGQAMTFERILWQGIHVCSIDYCPLCDAQYATDAPMGQAAFTPYQIHLSRGTVHGPADAKGWFGEPLAKALMQPSDAIPGLHQEGKPGGKRQARVLLCIDYIYGHALLKVLNATAALKARAENEALIIIVQPALRWLVPSTADAVWTVNLPFGEAAQHYYPALSTALNEALGSFEKVHLCPAWSHPGTVAIEPFTGTTPHDLDAVDYRVTYIWRGRRGWADRKVVRWAGDKLGLRTLAPKAERARVVQLFKTMRATIPKVRFTVAGFGKEDSFPTWIDDQRMDNSSAETERRTCQIYAESRLVIGPHGSNMLLPSAHAGMTLTLMPPERWGNLAQDTIMHGPDLNDPRLVAWRYRYMPDETPPETIASIATTMILGYPVALVQFQAAERHAQGLSVLTDGDCGKRQITT